MKNTIFLYGPPGAGKSTLGEILATELNLLFTDLDTEIVRTARKPIPEIFASEGESGFREREKQLLMSLLDKEDQVVALGGGSLLDPENREKVEAAGQILCLTAHPRTLFERLKAAPQKRPLLSGDLLERLRDLLMHRIEHYGSFPLKLYTEDLTPQQAAWQCQVMAGCFHVKGMGDGYDVRVQIGNLDTLGEAMNFREMAGPVVLVSDQNVSDLYADRAILSLEQAGFDVSLFNFPAGETHKNIDTISDLWSSMITAGQERGSTVVALGGGVTNDMAGFAAATYMRGIDWVAVPTSLLAMVDASLGGKTGIDLHQGKNLVGAFHPPSLVLADPNLLETLPKREFRNGLAEVVKHGVIDDAGLFDRCREGWSAIQADLTNLVSRAMAVKIKVIHKDPYEKYHRAVLNYGHTIGHALEKITNYSLSHGEAVSIGMVAETRLAQLSHITVPSTTTKIQNTLIGLGLPTEIPASINRLELLDAMGTDKKKMDGTLRFALPIRIGSMQASAQVHSLDNLIMEI
jgi:shikimate kinase/3-dehydroquinate synthase